MPMSDQDHEREKQRRKIYKLPEPERLMRSAVAYLERYASSSENLRRVLERKVARAAYAHDRDASEFSEMIAAAVERCIQLGLVDDAAYAETRASSLRRRGASKRQIEAKLAAKGVAKRLIERVLAADETDETEAARRFARRRRLGPWRTRGNRDDYRERDMAALCRAGFGFDVARDVVGGGHEPSEPV
ncbi:regulatory protein [Breoghania corrubedonensis]|uniref:Regulatory protein RecX n=2 Tax=Breoghania corrubedonensis TaxID=665038 RepID=A0A2T5V907_9HYPH|nr:regulatory protein [Breoghania corrubedonensis]